MAKKYAYVLSVANFVEEVCLTCGDGVTTHYEHEVAGVYETRKAAHKAARKMVEEVGLEWFGGDCRVGGPGHCCIKEVRLR